MATTTSVQLTEEQRRQIALALRLTLDQVPDQIGLVAISPEAGETLGIPQDQHSKFSPALIVT